MKMRSMFLLMALFASFSPLSSVSDRLFKSQTSFNGRNLLHVKKKCEVNFEYMDYKVITRRCKGPTFPTEECCSAFKEFSCPYVNQINDMSNDCAKIMFSYINVYGNYPPGLFANECKERKDGLVCPSPLVLNASFTHSTTPCLILLLTFAATTVLGSLVFI